MCAREREREEVEGKKFLHLDCNVCVCACLRTYSIHTHVFSPPAPASLPPDEWSWGRKNSIFLLGITNLFPISVKFFLILRTENPGDINNLHFLSLPGTICLRSDGRFWSTPSPVCVSSSGKSIFICLLAVGSVCVFQFKDSVSVGAYI